MAMAAAYPSAHAATPVAHGEQQAGAWSFFHEDILGTSLEVKIRARSLAQARQCEAAALAEIDRLESMLSAWRADSEFNRWSKTRFEAVAVSPELYDVLAGFDHWRAETGSALDPSAEAAIRLWRDAVAEGRTPTDAEIASAREAMAQQHWQLDPSARTATRLTDVPLALASFTKSYIASRAADAALGAGATGAMLNAGGDVIVRGDLSQVVDIADPTTTADNGLPLDRVAVTNRAVATSGSYRRGVEQAAADLAIAQDYTKAPLYSHIVDPRTARPTGHVVSSTVISEDPTTAAALATAFSVLSTSESQSLAARTPGVDYLLVTDSGRQLRSPGWSAYQAPGLRNAAFVTPAPTSKPAAKPGIWNPAFELNIGLELPRIDVSGYRRPFVAAWIEDADHYPVRTLALWFDKSRWLSDLKQWFRDDQMRNLAEGTDLSRTVSSATRPPGHYNIVWDGKDNLGNPVKAGKYTVVVEAAREHGSYSVASRELDFNGKPQQAAVPASAELGAITLDYRKR